MKNTENVERAADIVRDALNLMRKHSVPMHPVNYAVWHAYASGENLDLRNAIDRYMLQHLHLDDAVTEALYRRHVIGSSADPALLQRMSERMSSALGQAAESAARAGDQTAAYGSSLSRFQDGLAGQALPGLEGGLRLLVLGGSLGARAINEVLPAALALWPQDLRARMLVTQQCRAEDLDHVRAEYARLGVPAELSPFFPDVAGRLSTAHLVVARAGASTIAELACGGRPSVLVPLPHAIDDHQSANARWLADAGAALLQPQAGFTARWLADALGRMDRGSLAAMAGRARALGRPDAADVVARTCLEVAR